MNVADWIRTPYFDALYAAFGVALVVAIAVFGAIATWSVRSPGPVVKHERERVAGGRGLGRVELLLVRSVPWVVAGFAAYTVFPVEPPVCILLSSRSRSGADARRDERWRKVVDGSTGAWRSHPRHVDAGPTVDRVLATIVGTFHGSNWDSDDPDLRERLRTCVLERLSEPGLRLEPVSDLGRIHGRAPDLPRWLVESVEQAVLKGFTQRFNVSHIMVFRDDRTTVAGKAWDGIGRYLRSDAGRLVAPEVEILPPAEESSRPQLKFVRVVESVAAEGHRVLHVLLSTGDVPDAPDDVDAAGAPHEVCAELRADGRTLECRRTLELQRDEMWVERFEFDSVELRKGGTLVPVVDGLRLESIVVPKDGSVGLEGWSHAVRFTGHAAMRLERELNERKSVPSADPLDVRDWRVRLAQRSQPLEALVLSSGDPAGAQADAIVVDTDCVPGALWIRPASGPSVPPGRSEPVPGLGERAEAHLPAHVRPGVDSLHRVPLLGPVMTLRLPEQEVLASVRRLRKELRWGRLAEGELGDDPWVTRVPLPGVKSLNGTFLGFPAEWLSKESSPLDAECRDALWSAVIDACYASAGSLVEGGEHRVQSMDVPPILLTPSDAHAVRGAALQSGLAFLLAGVTVYGFAVLAGVRRVRSAIDTRRAS